ncbi:aldo/keto reductase [Collibacillus ludicampi]|jgi:L-glyceraldehyde 3-phosphate reductase|uniref:Aldo/keto reductase n=1 Tax=Collibacillus ludicampi TaxID=2771369 RepID=A0AAV4LLM2_9BACL|nr:aldo/keto reductase family protein [Collibacillus ludicampi]GIM48132.1 aldo/keto reductase [Collibacillus ludicampi]
MEYRRLGKSGLKVSEIALGSWLTYGTVTEREQAISCVHKAYELGINHFDCANMYGATPHAAEEVLGEALRDFPRESYVLTTKAFWPVGDGPNDRGLSRKHIISEVEKSLRAFKTDYVDIFYCHRYDPETDLEETLRAIDDLIRQGKVLYAGISEWQPHQIADAVRLTRELGLHKIVASQPIYNMFNRYIEHAVIPLCEDAGIGQVVFSPLGQGVLTGKYKLGQPAPAGSRAATPEVQDKIQRYMNEEVLSKVERLRSVAQKAELSLAQLALAWVLRQPNVASALVGATRPEQVEENVKASGITLSEEILGEIEEILA